MRRTVVGVFTHRVGAEAALRRLEMRGFDAECLDECLVEGARSGHAERSHGATGALQRVTGRLLTIAEAVAPCLSCWCASCQGEVRVKVRANSSLEARAAREILGEAGARRPGFSGESWTNWNW